MRKVIGTSLLVGLVVLCVRDQWLLWPETGSTDKILGDPNPSSVSRCFLVYIKVKQVK